jgi:hypothetical protein
MIDTPAITTTADQPTAVIRLTIPRSDIQKEMGPAHQELFSTLAAQGIAPTGPWFSHHFRMDPATFDFEVGVPVSAPVKPTGRVAGLATAGSARRAHHISRRLRGARRGVGRVRSWIKDAGLQPAPSCGRSTPAGPESGSDPAAGARS